MDGRSRGVAGVASLKESRGLPSSNLENKTTKRLLPNKLVLSLRATMANEGMQTRYRSLEEQVQQIRESQQKSADELRQALMEQNQALTNAINTAVTDLTLRMTQLNTVPASSSNYSPPPATPARTSQVTPYQPANVHHPRSPRCDMSTFDGTSPLDWLLHGCSSIVLVSMDAQKSAALLLESIHIEICEATEEVTQEGGITELVPEISLHALEGTVGPRTFRLTASVNGREFTVLIDTGSSHNYIHPRLAHYLHLIVDNTIRFPVAVGNGERIQSEGTCTTVPFTMQWVEIEADFHVLGGPEGRRDKLEGKKIQRHRGSKAVGMGCRDVEEDGLSITPRGWGHSEKNKQSGGRSFLADRKKKNQEMKSRIGEDLVAIYYWAILLNQRSRKRALPDSATQCHLSPSSKLRNGKTNSSVSKMNKTGEKVDSFAKGIREHVKLRPKITDTVKGKLILGAKLIQAGGVKKVFKNNFGVKGDEKLLNAFQCYLSTTSGPMPGLLFVSTHKLAFLSERSIKIHSSTGKSMIMHYKVSIPIAKITRANESENLKNPSEKYIQVVTDDHFEFWFMGFLYHQRTLKYLQDAISQVQ
nr:GEM-like protein 4 [Ipomoea batatas]